MDIKFGETIHRFRNPLRLIVLCLALFVFNHCTTSEEEDLMVYHGFHADDVKSLDPAGAYDEISWDIIPAIYETLFQYSYLEEPYRVVPLLAADMPTYSKDRLTVTIRLRKNIYFHDDTKAFKKDNGKGRQLVAEDFIYSFKRLANPKVQSQGFWIFEDKVVGVKEFKSALEKAKPEENKKLFEKKISGFKALDSHTLQIKLTKPYPQLLSILTLPFTAAVAKEVVDAHGDDRGRIDSTPIGTGPFVLKSWRRGYRMVLERNQSYHPEFYPTEVSPRFKQRGLGKDSGNRIPFLDRVELTVIKESQPAWLKFLAGKIDNTKIPKDHFASAIKNTINLSKEMKDKKVQLFIQAEPSFFHVQFNMRDPLLGKNKYLRQALSSAIDREYLVRIFSNGRDRKKHSILPPGIKGRPDDPILKYDYNPEKAIALLKKAGFSESNPVPTLRMDMRAADTFYRQLGEFFQKSFKEIGVNVEIIYNSFPRYLEKARQGNLQISYGGWIMDYPDPENAIQLLYGPNASPGPNEANFDHPKLNELYLQMAILNPGPKRKKIIGEIEKIVQEEVPWALLFDRTGYYLVQPWLKNYRPGEVITSRYKYLRIDKKEKKLRN